MYDHEAITKHFVENSKKPKNERTAIDGRAARASSKNIIVSEKQQRALDKTIKGFVKKSMNEIVEITKDECSLLMDIFAKLQDATTLIVSTLSGWISYEHIRLDRKLHLFVARSYEQGDYAGASVDLLSALEKGALKFDECQEAYFIAGSDEVAKGFYLDLITQADMFG